MPETTIAVWFRRDLRLTDHPALVAAAREAAAAGARLSCVYCLDPGEFGPARLLGPALDLPRTGAFRAQFLLESVAELRESLRALGSDLIVRQGSPADELPRLARPLGWTSLHFHRLVGTEERAQEAGVADAMDALGVDVHPAWDMTLVSDFPFGPDETPAVFSAFRKRVERECEYAAPLERPAVLAPPADGDPGQMPTLADLGHKASVRDDRAVLAFRGGEAAARERLDAFIWQDHVATYKETRNGLVGANYSSKLSAWLAHGCLSCRTVQREVEAYETKNGANDSTYWMTFELLWRDYFQMILLKHGASVFQPAGLQGIEMPWSTDLDAFEAWRTGRTGYPLVDASMRELMGTGYMGNRGRQIVGSFLTKNLGIDWRLGAEWFESQLIDYDVGPNYGNWNYTAGVGNDARGFRYFHIPKQASMYDPEGAHARLWCPELASLGGAAVHRVFELDEAGQDRAGVRLGRDYPAPIVDLEKSQSLHRRAWDRATGRSAAPRY